MNVPPRGIVRRAVMYCILAFFLTSFQASAQLPAPGVSFVPDRISAGSSFVMIANPGSVGGSVRVTWVTDEGYGHFPLINDRYMCYFSDTDYQSTCGPSPFRYPTSGGSPYILDIFTFDAEGNSANDSIEVEVGGLKIVPDASIDLDEGIANLLVYTTPSLADSVSYRIYDSSFNAIDSGYLPMNRITGTPYFNATVYLDYGVFYIAFKATAADDFGGGMLKLSMGGDEQYSEGVLRADPINVDVLVQPGSAPALPVNKRIINTLNQSFSGLTFSLPSDIARYVSISVPNSSIRPLETVYYTISLSGVSSSLDISTMAEIKSGSSTLGRIPIRMRVSYISGGTTDCTTLEDGAECLGGLCCGGQCRKRAECCTGSDCGYGETCTSGYACTSGSSDVLCASGSCRAGSLSCQTGETETGTCSSGGQSGVCCLAGGGECSGASNGDSCTGGLCCEQSCVAGAECCSSIDCPGELLCEDYVCGGSTGPGTGPDFLTIALIIAVAGAAGFGAWFFLKKFRKRGSAESDFEKQKDKDAFDEQEFY